MEPITNQVAESEIEVFNLQDLWDGNEVEALDIQQFLVEGLMLKEQKFRDDVKAYDWSQHAGNHVAVHCSTDAIVPTWAFMLIASKLQDVAASTALGTKDDLRREYYVRKLEEVDWSAYEDGIVVVKGCSSDDVPTSAYVMAMQKLQKVARKLMFGEPCSSVPLWRKPKKEKRKPKKAKAVGVKADLPTPGSS